jgi:hypothetical protein
MWNNRDLHDMGTLGRASSHLSVSQLLINTPDQSNKESANHQKPGFARRTCNHQADTGRYWLVGAFCVDVVTGNDDRMASILEQSLCSTPYTDLMAQSVVVMPLSNVPCHLTTSLLLFQARLSLGFVAISRIRGHLKIRGHLQESRPSPELAISNRGKSS